MVEHPIELSYADLLKRPLIERWITLACVSREVGGDLDNLIGNARFLGAPLADILREAGVQSGADQLLCTSSDGMTIGTPTAVVMDGRDAMLAVGMDGQPLPVEHGFPVRMVVPGLYGYVSACKWIVDIEATTFASVQRLLGRRGLGAAGADHHLVAHRHPALEHAADAPARRWRSPAWPGTSTSGWRRSRCRSTAATGRPARLAPVPSIDTWQQWVWAWTPTQTGMHTLRVRATNRDGQLQDGTNAEPYPGPATGWHTISVNVRRLISRQSPGPIGLA